MLTINTNTASLLAQNSLASAQSALTSAVQSLSSGLRVNKASDDAVSLALSQNMMGQLSGIIPAIDNLTHAINIAQTADSGLAGIQDILLQMKSLSTRGLDATLSGNQLNDVVNQLQDLNNAINSIAQNTKYNGIQLLSQNLSSNNAVTSPGTVQVTPASATIAGFSSANDLVALDTNTGFELTITSKDGTKTYSTKNGVSGTIYSSLNATFTDTNGLSLPTLNDLASWVNALSGAGLNATIGAGGELQIVSTDQNNPASSITPSGINPIAVGQGFSSSNASITLDSGAGFVVTVGSNSYSSIGSLSSNTTLGALANWISTLPNIHASIVEKPANSYNLVIYQNQGAVTQPISATGVITGASVNASSSNNSIVTASATISSTTGVFPVHITQKASASDFSLAGFANFDDQVSQNVSITVGSNTYSANQQYTINGTIVGSMAKTGLKENNTNDGTVTYSTVRDFNNWINALSSAGLSVSSSLTGTPRYFNNGSSDIHVQGADLVTDPPYYKLFSGSSPNYADQHAITSSIFQFASLDASSGPYSDKKFNFSTDGSGNLMLNVYDSDGQFIDSEIQSIPNTFNRGDTVQVGFTKLGATLKLTATVDYDSLGATGAEREGKIKEQVEAMVTNTGSWADSINWRTVNGVGAMRFVGSSIAIANLSYINSGLQTDSTGYSYTLDAEHQVALDDFGAVIQDSSGSGDPAYVKTYRFVPGNNPDGSPSNILTLQGYDEGGNLVQQQSISLDVGIYTTNDPLNQYPLFFDKFNIKLFLYCFDQKFPSSVVANKQIGQLTLGIANTFMMYGDVSSNLTDPNNFIGTYDQWISQPSYQIGDINTKAITINSFSGLPPLKYMLTQADGGKLVLAAYNAETGDFLASFSAIIDPDPSKQYFVGDTLNLDFGDLGYGGHAVLNFTLNTNATVKDILDLLTSNYVDTGNTPNITNLRTYNLGGHLAQYHLLANKDIGPASIPPLPVADVTELNFTNVLAGVDHFHITNVGADVTMSAVDSSGNITGSQTLTIGSSVLKDNKIVLNFDSIGGAGNNQGGVKIIINPLISSGASDSPDTDIYKNAATLIAQGLSYANKDLGSPGNLSFDSGSGLTLEIQGAQTGAANAVSIAGLNATDGINGSALSLTNTNLATAKDLIVKIGSNTYTRSSNSPTTITNLGTSYTINPGATTPSLNPQASVTINGSANPLQTESASISNQSAVSQTITTPSGQNISFKQLEFQSGAASNFHVKMNVINVLTNDQGQIESMRGLGRTLSQKDNGNLVSLTSKDSLEVWQSAFKNLSAYIDNAIEYVSSQRTYFGSKINTIGYNVQNLQSQSLNIQNTKSDLIDANYALSMSNFTKNQIKLQAATAVAAQANQAPSVILNLFSKSFSNNYDIQNFVY